MTSKCLLNGLSSNSISSKLGLDKVQKILASNSDKYFNLLYVPLKT